MLFYVSIDIKPGIFILFGEVNSYFDALKNLSFALLPIEVGHFYWGDFLFKCENKSLIGFSLKTALYFFICFVSFSYFLKLLISAMREPLGLVMERFDLTDLFLLISFLKFYLKFEIYHIVYVFYNISLSNLDDFLSE